METRVLTHKISFITFSIVISLVLLGCTQKFLATKSYQVDPKAMEILKKVNNVNSYIARYRVFDGGRLVFAGDMRYRSPNLFRKEFVSTDNEDFKTIIVSDGYREWTYTPFVNSVIKRQIACDTNKEIGFDPFLEADTSFEVSYVAEKNIGLHKVHILQVLQRIKTQKQMYKNKVHFYVDDNSGVFTQVNYLDENGNVDLKIILDDYRINIEIPEEVFVFKIPDGVIVSEWQ